MTIVDDLIDLLSVGMLVELCSVAGALEELYHGTSSCSIFIAGAKF